MRIAYADPPYLGMCNLYGHEHGDGGCWNDLSTYVKLLDKLATYDGWALSLSSVTLRDILPMAPTARVMAWCKTFAQIRTNSGAQFFWEPVLIGTARVKNSEVRDWFSSMPGRNQFKGSKPAGFVFWVLDAIGAEPDDEIDDLFYGSGAVTAAIDSWRRQTRLFA